jgi:23S rRNA-/tRNA-specific pseudouridylate synthase
MLVVIDKPAGLGIEESLAALADDLASSCKPVLRVDAEASGLAVLAPNAAAHRTLTAAFAAGQLRLAWLALVQGRVARQALSIDKALGPDRNKPGRVRVYERGAKRARPAFTEVSRLETFTRHSMVSAIPRTDRGHQLRVHLAAVHHPIVGDATYGAGPALLVSEFKRSYKPRVGVPERGIVQRLCLHATSLLWQRDDGELALDSPLPKEIGAAVARLRRYAGQ